MGVCTGGVYFLSVTSLAGKIMKILHLCVTLSNHTYNMIHIESHLSYFVIFLHSKLASQRSFQKASTWGSLLRNLTELGTHEEMSMGCSN